MARAMSTETTGKQLRILLVDDDFEVNEALAMLLRRDGHHVSCALSGQEAIDQLATNPEVDVVLTDLGMPDVNGWAVAGAAKDRSPKMPVGLVTGWGDDEELESAVERGKLDFVITKPIDRRTLNAALARLRPGPLAA
jgi:two-component system response regulator GlrR